MIFETNLIPTISLATHERPGCATSLINNILINSTQNLNLSGILKSKVSHHHPVFNISTLSVNATTDNQTKYPKYDFCESNTNKFLGELEDEMSKMIPIINFNEQGFKDFIDVFHAKIDENFLVDESNFKQSKRNRLSNPWITNGIIASVQRKSYFYEQWKKSCSKENKRGNESLYSRYKKYRLELRKVIKCAKKDYYCKKFDKVKGNIKKTWELINELRGKSKSNFKASFVINGKIVEDRREIAKEFNIFFSSTAKKLNSKVYSSTLPNNERFTHNFKDFLDSNKNMCNNIFLNPCSETEVAEIIMCLENGKASDIPILLLKKCYSILLEPLCCFYNHFLTHGIFPDILKKGSITPIYKKGDSRYFDNYRPVSTLPLLGKILEKIIYSRLYIFFDQLVLDMKTNLDLGNIIQQVMLLTFQ